jgi:hypothetical protein
MSLAKEAIGIRFELRKMKTQSMKTRMRFEYVFVVLAMMGCLIILLSITSCNDDENVSTIKSEIEDRVKSGTWKIFYFNDSGTDETNHFTGYNFTFSSTAVLTASNGTNTYIGTWSISDSNSSDDSMDDLHFNINFPLTNDFEDLNDDWEIISQSATKVELRDVSGGGGGTDYLTFQKN